MKQYGLAIRGQDRQDVALAIADNAIRMWAVRESIIDCYHFGRMKLMQRYEIRGVAPHILGNSGAIYFNDFTLITGSNAAIQSTKNSR